MPRWLKITGIGCGGLVVLGIMLVVLSAVLFSGATEAPEEAAGGQQGQEEQQQESGSGEEQATYEIGEEVPVGDVTYTVTNAERVEQLEDPLGVEEPLTGNFVVVSFTFTNNADEPVTVSDLGLYLYDSQDRQFETDSDAALYLPEDTSIFMLDRVNPGLSQEIQAVYSVPPEAEGFELEVTSGFFANESARIDLGF